MTTITVKLDPETQRIVPIVPDDNMRRMLHMHVPGRSESKIDRLFYDTVNASSDTLQEDMPKAELEILDAEIVPNTVELKDEITQLEKTVYDIFLSNCRNYSGNYECSPGDALQIAQDIKALNTQAVVAPSPSEELKSVVQMVCNMLVRDGTPVRKEAAACLKAAVYGN